jgi:stringent starvation protein B
MPKKVLVPVTHVLAIYARENGQGMSFPFDTEKLTTKEVKEKIDTALKEDKKPVLRIIK